MLRGVRDRRLAHPEAEVERQLELLQLRLQLVRQLHHVVLLHRLVQLETRTMILYVCVYEIFPTDYPHYYLREGVEGAEELAREELGQGEIVHRGGEVGGLKVRPWNLMTLHSMLLIHHLP